MEIADFPRRFEDRLLVSLRIDAERRNARDTVICETPAIRATSDIVGMARAKRSPPSARPGPGFSASLPSGPRGRRSSGPSPCPSPNVLPSLVR